MAAYSGLTYRGSFGGMLRSGSTHFVNLRRFSFGPPEVVDVDDNNCTITRNNVILQEGSSGVTDSVDHIYGGANGDLLMVRCATAITLEYGNGSHRLRTQAQNDYLVTSPDNPIWFIKDQAGKWLELSRSVNS
jgi:hypothetical protein